jgi:sortase A
MTRMHSTVRVVVRGLFIAGLLALGYVTYIVIDAKAYQAIEHRQLERARPNADARAVVDGSAIGEIQIARLGLSAIVAQGDSPAVLRRAVGHLAESAWPGETGNVVLAGHRDTFFRPLKRVRTGDLIILRTHAGQFAYLVESTAVVPPSNLQVIEPTSRRTLTLITCYPFSYVGPAPDRFIVRARQR